jgi:hypothetical protein
MTSTFFRNDAPGMYRGAAVLLSIGAATRQTVLLVS